MLDVAIIGCGVIGAAAAYELSHYPLQTAIFEAENDVADCTTKANSAILHAGYDPEPGTRMARLNVEGSALAKEICARLDVPYLQCGSLVLALSPEELPHLQKLYENGIANGVPGIRLLSAEETLAMEPNLASNVVGALYAPSAAIVSPWEFALAMAEVAVRNGVELHRSCPVTRIEKTAGGWALTTPSGIVETRYIINAAGISAQAVHDMAAPHKFTIQPTRGEYYLLDKSEGSRVHHVIFQCPNENGKGVLVAHRPRQPDRRPERRPRERGRYRLHRRRAGLRQRRSAPQRAEHPLQRVHPQFCGCPCQCGHGRLRYRRSRGRARFH